MVYRHRAVEKRLLSRFLPQNLFRPGQRSEGTSLVVKVGTKVKNIRLVDSDHNIDCKIEGIGAMKLKSEFVKKA